MNHLPRALQRISLLTLLLAVAGLSAADGFEGKVVGITDGDTLTLLTTNNEQVKVRLAEIDAPEMTQPFGTKAKQKLSSLSFGKMALVVNPENDRYGRVVTRLRVEGLDLSAEMVATGFAWVYVAYSDDPALPLLQADAKKNGLGLWKEHNAIPPWEWRRGKRTIDNSKDTSTANACNIKGNISGKGERIYHVPGSRYYQATKIDTSRGEKWFCSESEARSAGWRAPR